MQDSLTVATLLVSAARNYNIPNIYFAIPDRNSRNFKAFLEVLQKEVRWIIDACRAELTSEETEGTLEAEEIISFIVERIVKLSLFFSLLRLKSRFGF